MTANHERTGLMLDSSPVEKQSLRCPACRALQQRQDQCRRCRADLSLVVRAYDRLLFLQHRYQQSLQLGEAKQSARLLAEIRQLHPQTAQAMEQPQQTTWASNLNT